MDKKTWPTYMLPKRDPPQKKRPTQTESKGLDNQYSKQMERKKSWGAILTSDKIDFKPKAIK